MKYTLVSDGSSERALMPILTWSLRRNGVSGVIDAEWADLRRVRSPPRELADRIQLALILYPCDLLFVHRDAETLDGIARAQQISAVLDRLRENKPVPPSVRVVPVRMMEAWLIHDEAAIRAAANNPRGRQPLPIPAAASIEGLADPKVVLRNLLEAASGLNVRRRRTLPTGQFLHRISELADDFSALHRLPAFQRFFHEVGEVVQSNRFPDSTI